MQIHKRGKESLNTVGRYLCSLVTHKLLSDARKRTRLNDFGEPQIEPALSVLAESLEREADLHLLGRFLIRMHLRNILETRLRLTDFWREKWERLETMSIERPVFIVGMPRSGSTFLHELLAEDPQNRAPRVWEVMFPVPDRDGCQSDTEKRIRKAEACLWWFRRLVPEADSVYPMRARTPHECVAIHSYTLVSQEFLSTCRLPSYEAFLGSTDLIPAYTWERRFLQHLQLHSPPKRWILKSPDHVYGLKQLFEVFPDAFIIQTHRNPLEVLNSSMELTRVLQGLFGWRGDRDELAAREARVLAAGTERSIQFRDEHPELANRFIDVKYSEFVSNPLGVIQEIYRKLESPLTGEAIHRIRDLAAKRSRYSGQRNGSKPSVAPSEITAEEVKFRRYCSRFDLSWKPASGQ